MIGTIFDKLPLTERIFRKNIPRYYPYIIAENRGHPCEWYFYHSNDVKRKNPFGMVKYYKGRKLACYNIT